MDMITLAMAKAYADSKGGYTETKKVEVISSLPLIRSESVPSEYAIPTDIFYPTPGKTYEVTINGVTECSSATYIEVEGNSVIILGNPSLGGFEGYYQNTGETFLMLALPEEPYVVVLATHVDGETMWVSISELTEVIHSIDSKFLPDESTLEVIDLSYYHSPSGIRFSEKIEELFVQGGGEDTLLVAKYSENTLWKKINTDKRLRIVIPLSFGMALVDGVTVLCLGSTMPNMLCCSFMANTELGLKTIKIVIEDMENRENYYTCRISVVVE